MSLDKCVEALEVLDEAINFNPNQSELYTSKAKALKKLGRFDEAIPILLQAIE